LAQSRGFVDSVGRQIVVPATVARVMPAGPPASVLLYTLAPDVLVGWVPQPQPNTKSYLLPAARDLPVLPRLTGRGETLDAERVKALKPDLIVDFGSVGANYVTLAEKVKIATGIPYALIDGKPDKLAASLRLTADMLGRKARGEALAAYAEKTLRELDAVLMRVPVDKRPHVFVARGPDGLQSAVKGSGLTEIVERAGAINVAQATPGRTLGRGGTIDAPPAELSAWKPDLIVALDKAAFDAMRKTMPNTRTLLAPALPFGWLGEPPTSVNCLMGLRWLTAAFYPDQAKIDLPAATREFHRLFYDLEPGDAELKALLEHTL